MKPSHSNPTIHVLTLFCGCIFVITACTTATQATIQPTSQPTPLPHGSCTLQQVAATDEEAIAAVLVAESDLVVRQDIQQLMQLWNDGASVADAKNTPDDPVDDQRWSDKDAIRHRYVRIVFPGAPTMASPKDLVITINGTHAIITATTHIGNELSPAGDRWELSMREGCWGIDSLTYNLEKAQ